MTSKYYDSAVNWGKKQPLGLTFSKKPSLLFPKKYDVIDTSSFPTLLHKESRCVLYTSL